MEGHLNSRLHSLTLIYFPEGPALAQMAALQGRTFGRSLAGVLSGAAANLKSRLVGIQGISDTRVRASPSPPLRGEEQVGFILNYLF